MRRIPIEDARIGMILAADVFNAQQMVLLKKGARISDKNLRVLKSWGVETLPIQLPDHGGEGPFRPPEDRTDLVQELMSRFEESDRNPLADEICRVAAAIIFERRQSQK